MGYSEGKKELKQLLYAGYPFIYVVCDDERPVVDACLKGIDKKIRPYDVYTWNFVDGFFNERNHTPIKGASIKNYRENLADPVFDCLDIIKSYQGNAIFILHDLHLLIEENKHRLIALKDAVLDITVPVTDGYGLSRYNSEEGKHYKHIVITAAKPYLPPEINKLANVVYFGYPGKEEIRALLDLTLKIARRKMSEKEKEDVINASLGMTETEIANAYSKSMAKNGGVIIPKDVSHEKKQIIQKDGILEFHEPKVKLEDVGGLHRLIDWLRKRRIAYDEKLRKERRLAIPKGVLLTGIQGCGKSHSAKAIANYLEFPLLRLDVGSLLSKWVGESEENVRRVLRLADSIAPCVLWIDEIDKVIPSDRVFSHETTHHIFSTLLTWLQEKTSPVFVIATANNIDHLPPELMRKGRFDEIFFIDLPKAEERKEIFEIHLKKRGFEPESFDLETLVRRTDGYSGSEIEVLINEANFQSAFDGKPMTDEYLLKEIENTRPLSVTMKEKIERIRKWADEHNVRHAS